MGGGGVGSVYLGKRMQQFMIVRDAAVLAEEYKMLKKYKGKNWFLICSKDLLKNSLQRLWGFTFDPVNMLFVWEQEGERGAAGGGGGGGGFWGGWVAAKC